MALQRAQYGDKYGRPRKPHKPPTGEIIFSADISPSSSSHHTELPKILSVLAYALEYLIERNEQDFSVSKAAYNVGYKTVMGHSSRGHTHHMNNNREQLSLFHGLRPPDISVRRYLERIHKYADCSPSCFVVGYTFMDRFVHRKPDQPITSLNVHRLLITSIMLAAKTLDDVHYNNAFYAKVGGISTNELNMMEMDLLFRLDFRVGVTLHTFERYCLHLEREFGVCGHKPIDRSLPLPFDPEDSTNAKESITLQRQRMKSFS